MVSAVSIGMGFFFFFFFSSVTFTSSSRVVNMVTRHNRHYFLFLPLMGRPGSQSECLVSSDNSDQTSHDGERLLSCREVGRRLYECQRPVTVKNWWHEGSWEKEGWPEMDDLPRLKHVPISQRGSFIFCLVPRFISGRPALDFGTNLSVRGWLLGGGETDSVISFACLRCLFLLFPLPHRLVGLVVRRPPREPKTPGSNPACAGTFSGSCQ